MASSSTITDFSLQADQACDTALEFSRLYYDTYDRQRHRLKDLYMDGSTVIWNGNSYQGLANINDFYIKLPATTHELTTLDCHPISSKAIPEGNSILIVCEGRVKIGNDKRKKEFSQNFIITTVNGNNGKIVSDCFRLIDKD